MNIYFQPVNVNQWNIFEKVKGIGHTEAFLATKSMKAGDIMLLHVGHHDKRYESGIYAVGEIMGEPYVLRDHPEDYCNNRNSVNVRITKINYSAPLITHEKCKEYIKQFRAVHKLDNCDDILNIISGVQDEATVIGQIAQETNTLKLKGKEKLSYVKQRVNQSIFRGRLLERYSGCCVCKMERKDLLRASHIKPWSKSMDDEKLDVENGLLLCPNHDALFDGGFISFDDSGNVLISPSLTQFDRILMNVDENIKIELTEKNKAYMSYHRNKYKLKAINEFAKRWKKKFGDNNAKTQELESAEFGEACLALGFVLDEGGAFFEKHGVGIKDYGELKKVITDVNDIHLLGSAIFYRWRSITHWSEISITCTDVRKWFITALEQLEHITKV